MRKEQARRKRESITGDGLKLGIDLSAYDTENFVYRWVNGDEVRMLNMTQNDDYDVVMKDGLTATPDTADLGNAVSRFAGRNGNGSALKTYLCRKPRKFYEADQKKKQTDIDEQMSRIRRGKPATGQDESDYIPQGGIQIAS